MTVRILRGDCRDVLKTLPDESVHTVVTSPPYFGLRDYGVKGQMGLEATPREFIDGMVNVFAEVRRVLRTDGTLWLNLGDTYASNGGPGWQGKNGTRSDRRFTGTRNTVDMREQARTAFNGHKPKDLLGMPWMLAFALREEGWWLRQDIIWSKPNPMPESVRDRCTKAHEYIFLLAKSERYYFDADAIAEPVVESTLKDRVDTGKIRPDRGYPGAASAGSGRLGDKAVRNKRSVWSVTTKPYKEAHFATFPPSLIEPCVSAGSSERGVCPRCLAPWTRHTRPSERYAQVLGKGFHDHGNDLDAGMMQMRGENRQNRARDEAGVAAREYITVGWKPSCSCPEHEPVRSTVLDPFGGAGTTGLVADRLGRDAILIELNPKYADMAQRRIAGDAPLLAEVA